MGLATSSPTSSPLSTSMADDRDAVIPNLMDRDRNFDDLKDLFYERIYGSIKGTYRLEMTMQDIEHHMNTSQCLDSSLSYRALDIGGGLGQVSLWLATHTTYDIRVCYYDISQQMKEHVDKEIKKSLKEGHARITTQLGGIKEAIVDGVSSAQIICLHAVLEWLTSPIEDFKDLLAQIQPNGMLSLLYYNKIENIEQQQQQQQSQSSVAVTKKKLKSRRKNRKKHPLTPFHEFDSELIECILTEYNFSIVGRTGLRVNKFTYDDTKEGLQLYLKEEREIARMEPFCRQGRYNHIVAIKRE